VGSRFSSVEEVAARLQATGYLPDPTIAAGVVALAHAGVSDLRCLLPNAIDIHDVIAQLTAMTIGTADKLVPGAPRSRVPEPPTGWGGRSRFPRPGS
jgi:hypothetical protein